VGLLPPPKYPEGQACHSRSPLLLIPSSILPTPSTAGALEAAAFEDVQAWREEWTHIDEVTHIVVLQVGAEGVCGQQPVDLQHGAHFSQGQGCQIWVPEEVLARQAARQDVHHTNCHQHPCTSRQHSWKLARRLSNLVERLQQNHFTDMVVSLVVRTPPPMLLKTWSIDSDCDILALRVHWIAEIGIGWREKEVTCTLPGKERRDYTVYPVLLMEGAKAAWWCSACDHEN
jgi:hypothetical protein